MVMAASVNIPATKEYQGTHIVDEPENMAWEVADFLFGVKSIEKIATGKGTWGDALTVGITAATFFIPPAKLLGLGSKALGKVIVDAEKVAANEALSEVAKKVALRTANEAKSIRDTGLTLAENPTRPMSEARFKKITEPEPETGFIPEKPPIDKYESGNAPFRQLSEADEFGWTTKQESEYYGTGSDKTAKEIAEDRFEAKPKLKQDDMKPALKERLTPEEQAVVDKVNTELPETLTLPEEAGKSAVINRRTGELEFESSMTERTALPSELSISPRVDRAAWLQNKMDKLSRKKNSLPKEDRAKVQAELDKYDTEFKALRKKLTEEERAQSGKLYNELNKLDLKEASKTAPKTTRFNLDQSKKDLEKLREQWSKTPVQDFEKRNQLKQQGKTLADRIKKMEKDSGRNAIQEYMQQFTKTESAKTTQTINNLKSINSFRGENSFLSNMSGSSFKVGQETYPTVEHFFQAMKTTDPAERAKILATKTAGEAKKIGKTVTLRKNWNQIREEVMETGLRAKFQQNPELKKRLIDTGDVNLIEGNTWGDTFWGEVDGKGQNKLGKLLMKIRDELMEGK
jgi:ribA/ribD-fused uncharacterized protein